MKTKGFLLIALFMGFVFAAQAADHVKGNGKLTSKKITVDDYNSIKVDGVIDFNYEQSESTPHVEVTVDENLHDYVHIEVKDRVLSVSFKGVKVDHYTKFIVKTNSKWLREVKASGNANFMVNSKLTGDEAIIKANSNCLVQLKEMVKVGKLDLSVSGSANMVVNNLIADNLECNITGSGTITLKDGQAETGVYGITKDGEIMAFGVSVLDLNAKITGSGTIEAHPTDNMKASVIGGGKIRYKGPTAVQQKVIGKGKVEEVK